MGYPEKETTNLTFADIKNEDNIVDEVTFVKVLVMKYQQVVNYKQNVCAKRYTPTGKRQICLQIGRRGFDIRQQSIGLH